MSKQNEFDKPTIQEKSDTSTSIKNTNTILNRNQARAALYYDIYDPFLFDVRDELERVLSSSIETQTVQYMGGASPLLPILELVIITASGKIALTVLQKFSEDIYAYLKGKITKALTKENTGETKPVQINITIVAEEITASGLLVFHDYETLRDGLITTPQLISEVIGRQDKELDQIPQGYPISYRDGDKRTVSQSGLQFNYEYDASNKKWILKGLHKHNSEGE